MPATLSAAFPINTKITCFENNNSWKNFYETNLFTAIEVKF